MAPSHLRTVTGLLARLDPLSDQEFRAIAAQLDALWRRLRGSKWPRHDPAVTSATRATAEHARILAGIFQDLPGILDALGRPEPTTGAVFIPDAVDPTLVLDAGTGAAEPAGGPTGLSGQQLVPWWPQLPPVALQSGFTALADVPVDQLIIGYCNCALVYYDPTHVEWGTPFASKRIQHRSPGPLDDLAGYANTMSLLRSRDRGYHEFARNMRGGGRPGQAAPRQTARALAKGYHDLVLLMEPVGDRLVAETTAVIQTHWLALEALTAEEGETMPALASSAVVTSLATRIRDQISAGHGGRLVVSPDSEVAFSWNPSIGTTLLSFLATHTVTGRHATVVRVSDGAVKAGPVAEGAAKPTGVVSFTSDDVDLVKFAGIAEMPIESAQFISNIEPAISAVMVGQIIRGIEADAVAAITADAGVVITAAADITAGTLAAIAGIRGNGGTPTVVGLNSDDWIALMTETGAGGGYVNFSNPENGPAGSWMGLSPVLVPTLTAGNAIVADGSTVSVLEPAGGPLAITDIYTGLANNLVRVVIESWATSQVTNPGGVATVAVGP